MKQDWIPNVGDVLLTAWPDRATNQPMDKLRLTLVVGTHRTTTGWYARVIYGTSRHLLDLSPGDFVVSVSEDGFGAFRKTGLTCPTKFSLTCSVELPVTDLWFKVPADHPYGDTPKVGEFCEALVLGKVRRAIDALRASRFR